VLRNRALPDDMDPEEAEGSKEGLPPLPAGTTFEEAAEAGYLYDNLQTRMLSDHPFGEVTDSTLAEAKTNLEESFLEFGLVERFDESLIRLQRALGLTSIIYVRQRVDSVQHEIPKRLAQAAAEHNQYDIKLYRTATQLLEQRLDESDLQFSIDLAALRKAQGGDPPPPPDEKALNSPRTLWDVAVEKQAELLRRSRQLVEASGAPSGSLVDDEDVVGFMRETIEGLDSLENRIDRLEAKIDQIAELAAAQSDALRSPAKDATSSGEATEGKETGKVRRERRAGARAEAREQNRGKLELIRERIRELETAMNGDEANVEIQRELARLRASQTRLTQRLENTSPL
jgi:hypothetical protein